MHLEISILNGRGLMKADRFGSSDPYCRLFIGNYFVGETSCKKKTTEPNWYNEIFTANLSAIGTDIQISDSAICLPFTPSGSVKNLRIEVWDKNMFTDEVFMGQVQEEINILAMLLCIFVLLGHYKWIGAASSTVRNHS